MGASNATLSLTHTPGKPGSTSHNMKLFKNEIEELIRIVETSSFYCGIGVGEEPNVCHDSVEAYWKDVETGQIPVDVRIALQAHLMDFDGCVFLFPMGTHCGSLIFQTGWVHNSPAEEDVEEACMPQHN